MSSKLPKFCDLVIVGRPGYEAIIQQYGPEIAQVLTDHGVTINSINCTTAERHIAVPATAPRIICVIGGDGTFATAARDYARTTLDVIIGFQSGNLNFLNAFSLENGVEASGILAENTKISRRGLGYITGDNARDFANDLVLQPADDFVMDEYEIRDGSGRYILSFKGDGLIISTSMGSTAYNLSAGGPILHPTLDAFVITPKHAMHMGTRPIVMPMSYGLQVTGRRDTVLLVDGLLHDVVHLEQMPISIADGVRISVLLPNEYSFFEQAREKLGWFK